MANHWTPMVQLQRGILGGEHYVFDGGRKVALIRLVKLRSGRQVLRAVTWHSDPERRQLIAYVGEHDLRLLVEIVWTEWTLHHPPTSN